MENHEDYCADREDGTEALCGDYEMKRKNRADDIIAIQAVLCIVIGAAFFVGNMFYPDITGEVFGRIRALSAEGSIMPNPIDLLAELIDKF